MEVNWKMKTIFITARLPPEIVYGLDELQRKKNMIFRTDVLIGIIKGACSAEGIDLSNIPATHSEPPEEPQSSECMSEKSDIIILKLEELRQNREIEMKKIDFEEKKWEYEKQRNADLSKQMKEILEGPVGHAIEQLGKDAATRTKKHMQEVKAQCPLCKADFSVSPDLPEVYCINCGVKLARPAEIEWKYAKQGEAPKEEDALDKGLKANRQRIRDELLKTLIEIEEEKKRLKLTHQTPEKKDEKDSA
jgi:hypothetical protein